MMKQGVIIINCARGGIVNEEALHKGLVSGKVRAAALDVFEKEPPFGSPLLSDENCIFVPHLGASTKEAQKSVGIEIANQMKEALTTGVMRNTVNLPYIDPQMMKTLSPFIKLSEALGRLSAQLIVGTILGENKINIANLQLARSGKGRDALSVWSIDEAIDEATLKEIRKMPQVKEARAVVL